MEPVGVLPKPQFEFDLRHESPVLPPMTSTPKSHKPLRHSSSLRPPEFFSGPNIPASVAGSSRHMTSSPLRICPPITARVQPSPIDTTRVSPPRVGGQPLERVPTEPASAVPQRQQPTVDELAALGIKVRDFAFEPNTLPPVPSIRRSLGFLQNLKRPFEETPEDNEARKRNEAKRLEFNTPRRRVESPEANRLASSGPFIDSSLENGLVRFKSIESLSADRSSAFSSPSLNTSAEAGPSSSSSPKARPPLQRQASGSRTGSSSSSTPLFVRFMPKSHYSQQSPAFSPSRTSSTSHISNEHDQRTCISSQSPSLPHLMGMLSQFLAEPQSQIESQFESQSQGLGSGQIPPSLSTSQTDSETDSNHDDDEYIKTPLMSPSGSLIFEDDNLGFNGSNNTQTETGGSSGDASASTNSDTDAGVGAASIIDSSTLPESQVAELLAPVETGRSQDVTASQMGLFENQDLLASQPVWQQQSQSQPPSQLLSYQEPDGDGDIGMPQSQPEVEEEADESVPMPTLTPKASFSSASSSTTIARPSTSVCSYHASTSSPSRPLSRKEQPSSPDSGASSRSLLRHTSNLSRQGSLSSSGLKGKPRAGSGRLVPSNTTATSLSPGRSRYNLRTPSPKKSKLFDRPPSLATPTPRIRSRSRTRSAPVSKSASKAVNAAAGAKRSKRAVQTRRRSTRKKNEDIVMAEEGAGVGQEAAG